jgi:alpha-tubulin suppressor-like RCC1 family protein
MLQANGATYARIGMTGGMRCGQNDSGQIFCAGFAYNGEFGNGTDNTNAPDPISVAGGASFSRFVGGAAHMCALDGSSAKCWGDNAYGSVGDDGMPNDRWLPTAVSGGIAFTSIASSAQTWSNCGISTAGRAYCWGDGRFGELGNDTMLSSGVPVLVKLVR